MPDEPRVPHAEIQTIAETAVRVDRLLTQAKNMAAKLKETSDTLNRMVEEEEEENNAPRE